MMPHSGHNSSYQTVRIPGASSLAGTAGILRTDMAVHKETGRLHVQLLADVLANLDQVRAAMTALATLGFVAVLDARQFRWQGLAAGGLGTG